QATSSPRERLRPELDDLLPGAAVEERKRRCLAGALRADLVEGAGLAPARRIVCPEALGEYGEGRRRGCSVAGRRHRPQGVRLFVGGVELVARAGLVLELGGALAERRGRL